MAFADGLVTRASLLVNGASAKQALARAVAVGLPVGLHLNLTEGTALTASAACSLLGPDGRTMLGKLGLRAAAAAGRVAAADVAGELGAQLRLFGSLHPSHAAPHHLDGHQHVQCLAVVAAAIAGTPACSTCPLRRPIIHPAEAAGISCLPTPRADFYRAISAEAAVGAGEGGPSFVGFTTMGADCTTAVAAAVLAGVAAAGACADSRPVAPCEWMVHPGFRTLARPLRRVCTATAALCDRITAEAEVVVAKLAARGTLAAADLDRWREALLVPLSEWSDDAGCGAGPDDFSMSDDRETELVTLRLAELRRVVASLGFEVSAL